MVSEKDLDVVTHTNNTINKGPIVEEAVVPQSQDGEFDPQEIRTILKKIDLRLLPVLTLLYLMSFIDRSNIGNARTAGMNETLKLTAEQYNLALTIFFFPYALFEVPSNVVLKILRPSVWLPILVVSWGTVMTLTGVIHDYRGLYAARFFLGFTEAGLFPAASWLLTVWYCRHEMQKRMACFYCAATLAGAFSGLLAFAIQNMQGVGGLEGWRWIFILEGLVTVVLGIVLPFVLIDSPEKATFLSSREREVLIRRLTLDYNIGGADKTPFAWKYARQALTDWKVYASVVVFWGNTIAGYGFIFGLPNTIKDLGYTAANAQLLTIPVYFIALFSVMLTAYLSDKYKRRCEPIIYPYMLAAAGFIITMALPKNKWPGARYAMLFAISAGLYPALCGIVSWNANNLAGSWKRSIGIAAQITLGNLGGAVGSNIYIAKEAPNYWTGYGVSLAVLVAAIVSGYALQFGLRRANKKRDQMTLEEICAKYTPEQLADMGDKSPLFRYTL